MKFESALGPVKWHRADRRVPFWGPKNSTLCMGLYKSQVIFVVSKKMLNLNQLSCVLGVTPASALIVWTVLEPLVCREEDREVYSRLHLTLLQSLQGKFCG
jgi:hypothetical protein